MFRDTIEKSDFETNKERIIILINQFMLLCLVMPHLTEFGIKLAHFPHECYNYYKYLIKITNNNYTSNNSGNNSVVFSNLESLIIHIDSHIAYTIMPFITT